MNTPASDSLAILSVLSKYCREQIYLQNLPPAVLERAYFLICHQIHYVFL